MKSPLLILASASPRRSELLALAGLKFQVLPSRAHERFNRGPVAGQAKKLALKKASEVAVRLRARGFKDGLVLGADTIVARTGRLLAKPATPKAAAAMLRLLSGGSHEVITGLALVPLDPQARPWTGHSRTKVTFRRLSGAEIADYVRSGEPMDKAGAYAIQGAAAAFVSRISGDYFNVVGLPLVKLMEGLKRMGSGK